MVTSAAATPARAVRVKPNPVVVWVISNLTIIMVAILAFLLYGIADPTGFAEVTGGFLGIFSWISPKLYRLGGIGLLVYGAFWAPAGKRAACVLGGIASIVLSVLLTQIIVLPKVPVLGTVPGQFAPALPSMPAVPPMVDLKKPPEGPGAWIYVHNLYPGSSLNIVSNGGQGDFKPIPGGADAWIHLTHGYSVAWTVTLTDSNGRVVANNFFPIEHWRIANKYHYMLAQPGLIKLEPLNVNTGGMCEVPATITM